MVSSTVLPKPFPKWQNLDSSKLNEFADGNLKFCKNGVKFSKKVENLVEKGEIAHNEQFLLFLQCFLKLQIGKTKGLFGKGL